MNYYIIIEGELGAKKVYETWIPHLNSSLKIVDSLDELTDNSVFVFSAGGYPYYKKIIKTAIEEVDEFANIDCLVIAVDSEEYSYEEKYHEIESILATNPCSCPVEILIQHFCFEAWALGNRRFGPRNPNSTNLRQYKKLYDVYQYDPEELPGLPEYDLNRAKFAFKYLKAMIRDKNPRLGYNKNNPEVLYHKSYLSELISRYDQTNHIASFSKFLEIFSDNN